MFIVHRYYSYEYTCAHALGAYYEIRPVRMKLLPNAQLLLGDTQYILWLTSPPMHWIYALL